MLALCLVGILATLSIKTNPFKSRACNAYLTLTLEAFQENLSRHFTTAYLTRQATSTLDLEAIFSTTATRNTPTCSLTLDASSAHLQARNHALTTTFALTPLNPTDAPLHTPALRCPFADLLCRQIHHRFSPQ